MTQGNDWPYPFLEYDEQNTDRICLDFFSQFDRIEVEALDEYSVVICRLAIQHTDIEIYSGDQRMQWFFEGEERLHIIESLPEAHDKKTMRITANPLEIGYSKRDWSYISSAFAFQNLFFWQALIRKDQTELKYAEVVMTDITGIGGILSYISAISSAVKQRGLAVYLRPGCTRYPEWLLCKYFRVNPKPSDATAKNTMVIENLPLFTTNWYACQFPASFDETIFTDKFAEEMRDYADAVMGGKKYLGVLARGTDYLTMNLGADRTHARVSQMIPVIRKWMEEDGYEKIFLATEDQDNYTQMMQAFPSKVIVISQERMSVSQLKEKDSTLIYEYERKSNTGKAYEDALEDTTVNYFYALYLLSRCDAFLCSGQCNGWDSVRSLNAGKFKRERKLSVGIDGEPAIEDWKEVHPVTSGMFARASYPTDKAFFMTYRFDLAEVVDPDAIRSAWDKTLSVYPYMGYAVGTRRCSLVLLENPLPFIVAETSETIEPYGAAGNYHTVVFCYLGKTLWIYADHVPIDGTGFQMVLETFFYHYYCELDKTDYPAPEGVLTEKDGKAPGQDVDAYRMVDAIDPAGMMKGMQGKQKFSPIEAFGEGLFAKKPDCRGYCIRIPEGEFMEYAKSVGGSPMSVLAVLTAKAEERVHPENTLPINFFIPISVRKAMGNTYSLLHQVVHGSYDFDPKDFEEKSDEKLHAEFRRFLKGFSSADNIRTMCGVYRGICEGYAKAFAVGALDNVIMEQRSKAGYSVGVSYLGTLKTGAYGSRIRMTAFHAMPEKGIMIQMNSLGGCFYIDWYQGWPGDSYVRSLRDLMLEAGMTGAVLERTE